MSIGILGIGYSLTLRVIHLTKIGQFNGQNGISAVFNTQLNDALIESRVSLAKKTAAQKYKKAEH